MWNLINKLKIKNSEKPTYNVEKLLQPEKTFSTPESQADLKHGDMIEISPHSQSMICDISELLYVTKGCALIIDYGEDQALTDSIRAIRKHKYISKEEMLRNPGKADISAYVNFMALRKTGMQNFKEITFVLLSLFSNFDKMIKIIN